MGDLWVRALCVDFTEACDPTLVIPSPLEICARTVLAALDLKDAFVEHTRQVRAEQEAFQERIQAIGIERLMRHSPREVLEMFGC